MTRRAAVRMRVNPGWDHSHRRIVGVGHVRLLRCADCGGGRRSVRHLRLVPRLDVAPAQDGSGVTRFPWCDLRPLATWAGR